MNRLCHPQIYLTNGTISGLEAERDLLLQAGDKKEFSFCRREFSFTACQLLLGYFDAKRLFWHSNVSVNHSYLILTIC